MVSRALKDMERGRKSLRLSGYDYRGAGAYFVTIVATERLSLFEERTTQETIEHCWLAIPLHFPHVSLDEFVVMPNHVHGILFLSHLVGAQHAAPLQGVHQPTIRTAMTPGSLSVIIRSFKSAITKQINAVRQTPGAPVWQRNYYEHVIRNEQELLRIQEYIKNNPAQWALDTENPAIINRRHT